jgi:methionyl-tRNA formyltransferase
MAWAASFGRASIQIALSTSEAEGGDYLFLVSCKQIVSARVRSRYRHALVIHASDLPRGRGWSPIAWTILAGEHRVTVSLLEADDKVDSGAIWAQRQFELDGHELLPEINRRLFDIEFELIEYAIDHGGAITPKAQTTEGVSYYARRTPSDSRLDPQKSIAEQFDLIRICDENRYPAFFDHRGHRYELRLSKVNDMADPPLSGKSHENSRS